MARFSRTMPDQDIHVAVTRQENGGRFRFVLPDATERTQTLWMRGLEANFGGATVTSDAPDLRGEYVVSDDALPGFIGPMMMGALKVGRGAYVHVRDGAVDVWGFGDVEAARHIFAGGLNQGQHDGLVKIAELPDDVATQMHALFPDFE